MAPRPKKPTTPTEPPAVAAGPEGEKPIGPGVFKRPKRDPNAEPVDRGVPSYTPSDQVFRRR